MDIFRTDDFIIRRFKLFMKSQPNGKMMRPASTWAVSLMRYGTGTIKWNMEEVQSIGRLEKS